MITKLPKSKKREWRSIALSIFLAVLAVAVIGFLARTNWQINQRRTELQQKSEVLKQEIEILEEQIAVLQADIIRVETDEYQIERLYREGYFPEGAQPVVVLPPEAEKEEEVKTPEAKSPWQRFLELIGRD